MSEKISQEELTKMTKKFKNKLIRGKVIGITALVLFVIITIVSIIIDALGVSKDSSIMIIFPILLVLSLYPALFTLIRLPFIIKFFKRIKYYESENILSKMVLELATNEIVEFGEKAILTDNFLFWGNNARLPIPCNEILWLYTFESTTYIELKIGTKNSGIRSWSGVAKSRSDCDETIQKAFKELQKRTKGLLVNYTKENKAKYKELVGKK